MKKIFFNTLLALTLSACGSQATVAPTMTAEPIATKTVEVAEEQSIDDIILVEPESVSATVKEFDFEPIYERITKRIGDFWRHRTIDTNTGELGLLDVSDFESMSYTMASAVDAQVIGNLPNLPFTLEVSWKIPEYDELLAFIVGGSIDITSHTLVHGIEVYYLCKNLNVTLVEILQCRGNHTVGKSLSQFSRVLTF